MGSGAIEGSVIMCQNALERLAYYVLVHARGVLAERDFQPRGLPAAERMRRLLAEFNIPAAIGPNCHRVDSLPALAQAQGWADGPQALTVLRNSIVHPDQHNTQRLQNYPIPARYDAWLIGLWYLELILLKLFGYGGEYANRKTCAFVGETEMIP